MNGRNKNQIARRETEAFTLIELILAIAILGILAALLLPTLGRSKASARSAACLSNLHQIGLALQQYVDESENRLPLMWDAPLGTNDIQTNNLLPTVDKVLTVYLSTTHVLRCPSDDRALFAQTGSSYAWNTLLNGQDADRLQVLGILFDPQQIPLFFDKQAFHREKGEGRGVNYLYADGHIKNLLATETPKQPPQ
jgi:prepilin-type N-terminal cleavage/methylation domain-containing protein/prepilin-type processing-associated H-X9-DG protein